VDRLDLVLEDRLDPVLEDRLDPVLVVLMGLLVDL
jgi:hypothetical protein